MSEINSAVKNQEAKKLILDKIDEAIDGIKNQLIGEEIAVYVNTYSMNREQRRNADKGKDGQPGFDEKRVNIHSRVRILTDLKEVLKKSDKIPGDFTSIHDLVNEASKG